MATTEERVDRLEGVVERLGAKLDRLEAKFDAMDTKIDANHAAAMKSLEAIAKCVGANPNF